MTPSSRRDRGRGEVNDPVVRLESRVGFPDELEAEDRVPIERAVAAAVHRHAAPDLLHQHDDLFHRLGAEEDCLALEPGDQVRQDMIIFDEAYAVKSADLAGEQSLGVAVKSSVDKV